MAVIIPMQPYFLYDNSEIKVMTLNAPTIARRFAASLYEFVLLFGIFFITGALIQLAFLFIGHAAPLWVLQVTVFITFGCYFTYSWTRSGQTLAQKTWHIRIIQADSNAFLTTSQAWKRYVTGYFGVFPALLLLFTQIHHATAEQTSEVYGQVVLFLFINWIALLGTAWLNPERRAIHETLSNSRTVYQKSNN